MKKIIYPAIIVLSGCSSVPFVDTVIDKVASANHLTYSSAELIMCRGITVGEWMRSIGPYPEKVAGWRALCVGSSVPSVPVQ